MASALMNMMMDEEKKKAAPTSSPAPAQAGQTQGGTLPQMPPPPVPGTPAQASNAGQGPVQPDAEPTAPTAQDPMALLALGQGPINPERAPRGRAMPPRGRSLPPRASASTATPTPVSIPPVATGSYSDPRNMSDAAGDLDIPTNLTPEEYRARIAAQPSDAGVPLEKERPMPKPRNLRGVINPNAPSTPVRPEDFTSDYQLNQGFSSTEQSKEPSRASTLLGKFNPVDPIFADQNENQVNRSLEIADRVIAAATGKFSGVNPLAPLKQIYTSITREINALRQQQNALVRGDVNAVMETLPLIESDPVAQALRGTTGATMDVVGEQLKAQGKNIKGISGYVRSEYDRLTSQIEDITNSTAFKALENTIQLAEESTGSNQQKVARGGLAFMLGVRSGDGSLQQQQAQRYFSNQRMAGVGMPIKVQTDIDFEDMLGSTPGFEKYFKRGNDAGVAKQAERLQARDFAAGELIKTSGAAVMKDLQSGKNLAPAVSAKNTLTMRFLEPLMSSGDLSTTSAPWIRHMQRNIASLIPVADDNIGTIVNMAPGVARDAMMKTLAASYSGKSFITNLFDFNYKGRETEFAAASNIIDSRLTANDPQGAARALAPYASDDQLRLIFGPENTSDVGIYGEQSSTFKDPYTAPIYEMTGFGGARRQRIEAYRARQIKTLYATKRQQESNSGLSSGRPVIAGLAGLHGINPSLLGLPMSAEDVKSTYNAFVNAPEDLRLGEAQRYSDDLIHFITPNVDDKMNFVPDDSWDESVRSLDVAIHELKKNIDSGVVSNDNIENAKLLLTTLTDARDTARAELESGIEVGTNRGILFRSKGGEVDYGQPIKALTGQGRTAQAVDMIGAWVAGKSGVDIPHYFSAQNRSVVQRGSRIVGFAEDVDGNPIRSKPIYVQKNGVVTTPVFQKDEAGSWVPVTDVAGRAVTRRKSISAQVVAEQGALQSANADTTSIGVDDNYVRLQMNGFARDIMGLIKDAPDMDERGSSFSEITGIPVEENGRFTFADFERYLTTMTPYKGKQLLGWLNTYSSNAATAPSPRVAWAMNASSSRGRATGIEDRAITNVERSEVENVKGLIYKDFDTTWHGVTATGRAIINDMEAKNAILDPEADLTATKNIVTKQILKQYPYIDESTPEGQIVLRNLDQWLDAYIRDDMETQVTVHKQAKANISAYAKEAAPDIAEENIRQNIKRGNAATITPEEKKAKDEARRKAAIEANAARQAEAKAKRDASARAYFVAYVKGKGWVDFSGPRSAIRALQNSKDFENVPDSITQKPARSSDVQRVQRASGVVKVAGGTKINQPSKAPTSRTVSSEHSTLLPRPPALRPQQPELPTPAAQAPKPRKGSAAARRLGGAGLGVLGFYGITQRRGGQ